MLNDALHASRRSGFRMFPTIPSSVHRLWTAWERSLSTGWVSRGQVRRSRASLESQGFMVATRLSARRWKLVTLSASRREPGGGSGAVFLDPWLVVKAMAVWTGWGTTSWPQRDDTRLAGAFGDDLALDVLPVLKDLEDDFYLSEARHVAHTPIEMRDMATAEFRQRHPEAAEEIVKPLAWCYTFDYK